MKIKQIIFIRIFMIALGIGTILNFFMTILGLAIIFNTSGFFGYLTCTITAVMFISLKLCSDVVSQRRQFVYLCIRYALAFTIILDAFAVFNAITIRIIGRQFVNSSENPTCLIAWSSAQLSTQVVSIGLIIFLVAAPVMLPFLLKDHINEMYK